MQLFDYQVEDAKWMSTKTFAGNFSGMGTGKTRAALEASRLAKAEKLIIVGPPISLAMWLREAEDHLGLKGVILRSGKTKIDDAQIIICSYTIATTRAQELRDLSADVLILDESHAIKTPTAKRTQALIGEGGIWSTVKHTYCLTGTPAVRWADDLYTFMARANPAALKAAIGGLSLDKFRLRYNVTQLKQFGKGRFTKKVQVTVGNRNEAELHDMLYNSGMATRRELAEVWAEMPDMTVSHTEVPLDMSTELRAMLKNIDKMSMSQIQEDLASKEPALATVRRELGMAKCKAAVSELTARIQEGNGPILVAVWHRDVTQALYDGLKRNGILVAVIDGRTTSHEKESIEARWNAGGSIDILLGQIAACGTSLNLQAGGHKIVEVEQDWSPALTDQYRARLLRIGQQRTVSVETWGSDTKLDKAIRSISARKAAGHKAILEGTS